MEQETPKRRPTADGISSQKERIEARLGTEISMAQKLVFVGSAIRPFETQRVNQLRATARRVIGQLTRLCSYLRDPKWVFVPVSKLPRRNYSMKELMLRLYREDAGQVQPKQRKLAMMDDDQKDAGPRRQEGTVREHERLALLI